MADVHGIALDTKNGWIFVVNYGNGALYEEGGDPTAGPAQQSPARSNQARRQYTGASFSAVRSKL